MQRYLPGLDLSDYPSYPLHEPSNPNEDQCKENTVNSEIFARILFSRIALKDIFSM